MADTRAKFRCNSVKFSSRDPREETRSRYSDATGEWEQYTIKVWPRTFEFSAVYDDGTPEHERYSMATPYGVITLNVDNPAVDFEPGALYYVDFTREVEAL